MCRQRSSKKRLLIIVGVNCVVCAMVIGLGELVLRIQGNEPCCRTFPGEPYAQHSAPWAAYDSLLGWTVSRTLSAEYGPSFAGQVNPQGFRDKKDYNRIDPKSGKTRVMILGDSFVFGAGLPYSKTFPQVLQAALGNQFEVYNLGVPGFGVDQMYLTYLRYRDVIAPHVVILAFIDEDAERVLQSFRAVEGLTKPTLAIKNDSLVVSSSVSDNEVRLARLLQKSILLSWMLREVYLMLEAKEIVERVFQEVATDANRRGGRLIVLRIPTKDDDQLLVKARRAVNGFPDILSGARIPYLDPLADFTANPNWRDELFLSDGHLSVLGNKRLATYLVERVF